MMELINFKPGCKKRCFLLCEFHIFMYQLAIFSAGALFIYLFEKIKSFKGLPGDVGWSFNFAVRNI